MDVGILFFENDFDNSVTNVGNENSSQEKICILLNYTLSQFIEVAVIVWLQADGRIESDDNHFNQHDLVSFCHLIISEYFILR